MKANWTIVAACLLLLLAVPAMAERGTFRVRIVPAPPNLSAQVTFSEPSGNNILDGAETGKLSITVKK
jgi:hypothetical protein